MVLGGLMKLFDEFKAFVMRGNVVDLAVGVIIGAAFGKIVTSLVNDIFMPIIGMIIGNIDFSSLVIKLGEPVEGAEQAAIRYGMFIQEIVNFLIIALCVFVAIKLINKLQKKKEEASAPAPGPTKEEVLLTEIRDALNKIAEK
ncbi:large conductance mechanosensitive channel protein MscL [Fusobacterium nucleatum subsp. nucleatum ATCC 25586]|uniref:Large-conductance mechanosensitive channel n=3 Tax=Fusobacterium nucleatum TaxID=851 RepID=MSCL_FUSNN|nr:RecName: Full=Large-conductance mechanosensitive channel [Fusobacterium nucleatum subsp. nucleatum ATCC 25586]AAL94962.1 Large-conductance mechanosensitive channel [Fusobacterium nucleatum subsp. nucleatum ATCC 25586]AVQ15156.1 large conductance mechanosensitive channel protein MscL [Fusobacterium nucleatum subsp. nucleatum ATCC 25586]